MADEQREAEMTLRVPQMPDVEAEVELESGRWRLYEVRYEKRLRHRAELPQARSPVPVQGAGGVKGAMAGLWSLVGAGGLTPVASR